MEKINRKRHVNLIKLLRQNRTFDFVRQDPTRPVNPPLEESRSKNINIQTG